MSAEEKMMQAGEILENRYRIVSDGINQDIGIAYKAYDMEQDRLVVVLALARRFENVAEVMRRLTKSQQTVADLAQPALIPFERVRSVDGQLLLVRNHVEGQSLADLLARRERLTSKAAVEITISLCKALTPAHQAGLIHGGLSPHSVLIRDDGQVAMTEMSMLPALRPALALPGQPWGRFPYLSPEQAAGEDVRPASDVYVLGLLLYEMLAGRPPFDVADERSLILQHLRHDPPILQSLVPDVSPLLAQIVHKALAKEPAVRYRHAGQLAHILRTHLGARQPEPVITSPIPSEERMLVPAPSADDAEFERWGVEASGVDWLMVALIIAALIAVLGLIPLWRTVYQRYAAPPPTPLPAFLSPPPEDMALFLPRIGSRPEHVMAHTRLDDPSLVWYNLQVVVSSSSSTIGRSDEDISVGCWGATGELPGLGVQLTGLATKVYYTITAA
ncbi:MAG: serine/threonine-protein kinase [Anaerolineae bacterium]|jgi:serine/threonine protein kinase